MKSLPRYLYLLRKLYLTRSWRKSWSQFGEDVALLSLLGRDKLRGYRGLFDGYGGFFVDVGCYHPVKHSNTWVLYRRGWRGVNIDIDPIKIEAFDMVRGEDTNVVAAVSPVEGEVTVYNFGKYSLLTTLDADTARKYSEEYGKQASERTVKARSLTAILDDSPYSGRRIDVLTVDAEGHDLEVLQSLDFERYRPLVVLVENHERELDKVMASELHRHLEQHGYAIVNWVGFTLFYTATPVDEIHVRHNRETMNS